MYGNEAGITAMSKATLMMARKCSDIVAPESNGDVLCQHRGMWYFDVNVYVYKEDEFKTVTEVRILFGVLYLVMIYIFTKGYINL